MEPSKQPRNPNDLLIFQNIDDEDFEWQFDAIRTPLPYFIAKGEVRELPFYIAKHGVEKLIDRILQKKRLNHMNIMHRKTERDKIVLGIKQINNMRAPTANELALQALQRKKDADPYEELFKEREVTAQQQAEAELAAQQRQPLYNIQGQPVTQPIAQTPGIPAQPVVPNATVESSNQEALSAADPERLSVYNFLQTRAHMDMGHPQTRQKLDAMSVDDIRAEFGEEFPDIIDPGRAPVADTKESLSVEGMPVTPAGNPIVPQVPPQPQPVSTPPPVAPVAAPVTPPQQPAPAPSPVAAQPTQTVPQPVQTVPAAPAPAPAPTIPVAAPVIPQQRPSIPMNPAANAAPLLDEQLQQVR